MSTTAGSLALVGSKPFRNAGLVQRLREAGVLLLGKTNLSEWANIRCSYSTSGWSGRGGLTRNPYVLNRNTSGSSSGSAVAVAANLCAAAVGTETDGSIISPSSVNGIVGIYAFYRVRCARDRLSRRKRRKRADAGLPDVYFKKTIRARKACASSSRPGALPPLTPMPPTVAPPMRIGHPPAAIINFPCVMVAILEAKPGIPEPHWATASVD